MTAWTTVGLKVQTPMFLSSRPGGGAELRVPSLRGAARFWFRTLVAPVFNDDFSEVAKAEAEVFGSAADDPADPTKGPSPVAIRLLKPPRRSKDGPQPAWLTSAGLTRRGDNGVGYLLGQAYFHPPDSLTHASHFPAGAEGAVAIRVRSSDPVLDAYVREAVGVSLWALATFGGLGARTRRGFGGLTFTGLDDLCPATAAAAPADRGHPAIRRLQELVALRAGRPVPPLLPPPSLADAVEPLPEAPSWSRWYLQESAVTGTFAHCLNVAGGRLREYRAPVNRPDKPKRFKQWVTREYRDIVLPVGADTAPDDPAFRIGAFGLPVVFGLGVEVKLFGESGGELRRASPLWIRAVPQPDGRFRLLYQVFQAQMRPPRSRVVIPARNPDNGELTLDDAVAYRELAAFLVAAVDS